MGILSDWFTAAKNDDLDAALSLLSEKGEWILRSGTFLKPGIAYPASHVAAFHGSTDILILLLDRGVEPDLPIAECEAGFGNYALDVREGAPLPFTAIDWAAAKGDEEVVQILLDAGASPDGANRIAEEVPKDSPEGFPDAWPFPLSRAICASELGIVNLLLKHGACPNRLMPVNRWLGTPLAYAWRVAGIDELCELLMAYGAELFTNDHRSISGALQYNGAQQNNEMMQRIIQTTFALDQRYSWGVPLAPFAIYNGFLADRERAIGAFLKAGADPTLIWKNDLFKHGGFSEDEIKDLHLNALGPILTQVEDVDRTWPSGKTLWEAWEESSQPVSLSKAHELFERARKADLKHLSMEAITEPQKELAWELTFKRGFLDKRIWGFVKQVEHGVFVVAQFQHDIEDTILLRIQNKRDISKKEFPFEKPYSVSGFNHEEVDRFIKDGLGVAGELLGIHLDPDWGCTDEG